MNELERLIAGLPQPEPSKQLDERIDSLLATRPTRRPTFARSRSVAWPVAAVCCGLLGFFVGRESVAPPTISAPPALHPPETRHAQDFVAVDRRVVSVPLEAEQFARLFLSADRGEGPFGQGPLSVKTSTTP